LLRPSSRQPVRRGAPGAALSSGPLSSSEKRPGRNFGGFISNAAERCTFWRRHLRRSSGPLLTEYYKAHNMLRSALKVAFLRHQTDRGEVIFFSLRPAADAHDTRSSQTRVDGAFQLWTQRALRSVANSNKVRFCMACDFLYGCTHKCLSTHALSAACVPLRQSGVGETNIYDPDIDINTYYKRCYSN
jgi:hypothetical protein